MRICIPVPCFFRGLPFDEAIEKIGKLGFDAAETYRWDSIPVEKTLEACKRSGVELLSMCTTAFDMTDPAKRDTWLAGLKESCAAARRLNVKKLITQVGADTGAERAYQHESIVCTLKAAKGILEEYGVTVMIEPLNTYVDHPGYYLTSSREAFDIVREADHPLVKVVYDIYHQQIMEGNIIPSVTNNLDCIAHLHAAGHPGRHELQNGESDYRVIMAAIDRAGYTGAMGLEYTPTVPSEESLNTFRKLYLSKE